jgi:DGQHR domain-containing protein
MAQDKTKDKKVSIEISAIRVKQRPPSNTENDFQKENDFFLFSLDSNMLLKITKFLSRDESKLGIQRKHKEERDKEIGSFIVSEYPFFPNTIIINIPLGFKESFYSNGILKFEVGEKTAYVIDGQHRLKAFDSKYSKGVQLNMVVAAYFGLELPTIAEIFTRINFFQRPVSKSLVYDLLNFNKDPEFSRYREAHEIATLLNEKIDSPFYSLIKILGTGEGLISQAAFVEAFSTRYKVMESLKSFKFEEKTDIIDAYFKAVKQSFPNKWANSSSILSRTIGFNALVKLLAFILAKNKISDYKKLDFSSYIKCIKKINVDSEEIKTYGGFKGVNKLADMFVKSLGKE